MGWKNKMKLSKNLEHLNVNIMGLLKLTYDWFLKKHLVVAKFKVKKIFIKKYSLPHMIKYNNYFSYIMKK
jgi:hypothetical protein